MLGPLVVGAFACEATAIPAVVAAGARDSKQLTPSRREEVYRRLESLGERRWISLPPRTIDRYVARGRLNQLELEAFAELVRAVRPDVAYVDACDPNEERFGQRLATLAGGTVRVVSRHRADRDLPIVGAASVVAKVRRDAELAELRTLVDEPLGTGYPSDPTTRDCVLRHAADGRRVPPWMRRSWETVQRVKRSRPARTLEAFAP